MKRKLVAFILASNALLLTSCAGGGTSALNEYSFISGNGVATFIPSIKRDSAPLLSGKTLAGGVFTDTGKSIRVVNVWASWCAPCRAEAPALQSLAEKYPEVQFIGILTRDNLSSASAFVERFKLSYPTLVDDSILVKFRGKLTPGAIPTTLIIDSKGKIAARISGEITIAGLENLIIRVSQESP